MIPKIHFKVILYIAVNSIWYNFFQTNDAILSNLFPILGLYFMLFSFMFNFLREDADSNFSMLDNTGFIDISVYILLSCISPISIFAVCIPNITKETFILTLRRMLYDIPWKINQHKYVSPFYDKWWYNLKNIDSYCNTLVQHRPGYYVSKENILSNIDTIRNSATASCETIR